MEEQEKSNLKISEVLAIVKTLSIHSKVAQLVRDGVLEEREGKFIAGDKAVGYVWKSHPKFLNGNRVEFAFRQTGPSNFKNSDGTTPTFSVPTDVAHANGEIVVVAESL